MSSRSHHGRSTSLLLLHGGDEPWERGVLEQTRAVTIIAVLPPVMELAEKLTVGDERGSVVFVRFDVIGFGPSGGESAAGVLAGSSFSARPREDPEVFARPSQ